MSTYYTAEEQKLQQNIHMKKTFKRTVLDVETVAEHFRTNPNTCKFYCALYTDYEHQRGDGSYNPEPPTEEQLYKAAVQFSENHFGIEGRIATEEECDAIAAGTARLI